MSIKKNLRRATAGALAAGAALTALAVPQAHADVAERTIRVPCNSTRSLVFSPGNLGAGTDFRVEPCHSVTRYVGSFHYPGGNIPVVIKNVHTGASITIKASTAKYYNLNQTTSPSHPYTSDFIAQ